MEVAASDSSDSVVEVGLAWERTTRPNDINVQDVQFLGQRGDSGGQEPASAPEEYQEADLPF